MNIFHRWYCNSDAWAKALQGVMMPRVLEGVELGDDVLEIGPGPGRGTEWLKERVARVTAIEIDPKLADSLKARMDGSNVTVVEGDATAMPFPDASFSSAVCFTMLHHVPSAELQDRLLAEACRVLRPGAPFAGADSTPSLRWNLYHVFDTRVPADPDTFGSRLERAGFVDVQVRLRSNMFSFHARKPA